MKRASPAVNAFGMFYLLWSLFFAITVDLGSLVAHFPQLLRQSCRPLDIHRSDLAGDCNFERFFVFRDVDLVVAHTARNEERIAGGKRPNGAVFEFDDQL